MEIAQARKLLGIKYKNLTDEEVKLRIKKLKIFATSLVDAVLEKSSTISFNEKSNNLS